MIEENRGDTFAKEGLCRWMIENAKSKATDLFNTGGRNMEKFDIKPPTVPGIAGLVELRLRDAAGNVEEVNAKLYKEKDGIRLVRDMGTTDDQEILGQFFQALEQSGIPVSSKAGFELEN